MRRLLGHVLAALLTASLSASVLLWTLGATLASPSFLEHTADQTGLYDHLASGTPGADPTVIRSTLESAVPQLIDYVSKGGAPVTIDLPGITDGPVALSPTSPQLTQAGQELRAAAGYLPVAAVVLFILIFVLTGRMRWRVLARAAWSSAISLGISAAIFWLAPSFIGDGALKNAPEAVKAGVADFLTAVLHAFATHLAIAAAALLVIGIIFRLIDGAARLHERFARPPKPQAPLPPAGPRE